MYQLLMPRFGVWGEQSGSGVQYLSWDRKKLGYWLCCTSEKYYTTGQMWGARLSIPMLLSGPDVCLSFCEEVRGTVRSEWIDLALLTLIGAGRPRLSVVVVVWRSTSETHRGLFLWLSCVHSHHMPQWLRTPAALHCGPEKWNSRSWEQTVTWTSLWEGNDETKYEKP